MAICTPNRANTSRGQLARNENGEEKGGAAPKAPSSPVSDTSTYDVTAPLETISRKILVSQQILSDFDRRGLPDDYGKAMSDIIATDGRPHCSIIIITDDSHYFSLDTSLKERFSSVLLLQDINLQNHLLGIFRLRKDNYTNDTPHYENDLQLQLKDVVSMARSLRQRSKCVTVVVLNDDSNFLETFAEGSLGGRLLVWTSRLLVITRLSISRLRFLMAHYWTFSMMNTIVLNLEGESPSDKGGVYFTSPYDTSDSPIIQIATWSHKGGLRIKRKDDFYSEKFANFFGATVNVTALPYAPHWIETSEKQPDGTTTKMYGGTDYQLLSTIAASLNFTINVLQPASWDEVTERVEERTSYMATVFHSVLPQRLERYDYTYTYESVTLDFCVAKPGLKPQWQALYYPFTNGVWLSVLAAVVLVPLFLRWVRSHEFTNKYESGRFPPHFELEVTFATLLGQTLPKQLPGSSTFRIILGTWLVFAFIVGTAYRGNLTASLSIPKYPPRVETVEQLVTTFDRITMPPFGNEFIKFFKQSDNLLYKSLAYRMSIVPSVMEGLRKAINGDEAHVAGRRYMEQTIAKEFSNPDGSTKLYVGRESILPGISAWPIPHDAPYRQQIDRVMMSVIEGGLYEQWSRNILRQAQSESRKRTREYLAQKKSLSTNENEMDKPMEDDQQSSRPSKALTVVHMQGPLMLLLLGLIVGGLLFSLEIITHRVVAKKPFSING
ncbi:ionotropic receptor 21a-like [Palaemon carinicauda]|uniref:ionotropic receptor 21a-like n=1 Tax=Palaemon carinicauda TaxID=392227 RepID=UPI0035B5C9F7